MKPCDIGGQGVLEGVMMRSAKEAALAVRKSSGEIVTSKWKLKEKKKGFLSWPVVRGCVNFVSMLTEGMKVITDSAKLYEEDEEEKPAVTEGQDTDKKSGKSDMDKAMILAVVLALALCIGLFFLLPSFLVGLVKQYLSSSLLISLVEGLIRIIIFMGYMFFCTCVKDVKRVFMYHGAEHKTITCYENELPLTVENVRPQRRLHPRCGTSYLLLVMIISILIYSIAGALFAPINQNLGLRVLSRLILLPLIAGVSYEILKGVAKHENIFTRIIRWPGMQLQRLTTKEPDDSMMEIAILAFEMALGEKTDDEIEALKASFDRSTKEEPAEAADTKEAEVETAGTEAAEETGAETAEEEANTEG